MILSGHSGTSFKEKFWPSCHSGLFYMLGRALTKCHEFLEVIHHIPEVMQSPVMSEEQWEKCNKERSSILWKREWVQTTGYYWGEKIWFQQQERHCEEVLLTLQVPLLKEIFSFSWRNISICSRTYMADEIFTPSNFPCRFTSLSSFKYLWKTHFLASPPEL